MRRASFTPAFKVSVDEPLIVVDESEELENLPTSPKSVEEEADDDKESPDNPYLLSPFRDPRETRKHSLPNIQCTNEITASQVRRLSDGGENAPSTSEMAFLAKLSQVKRSPQPSAFHDAHFLVDFTGIYVGGTSTFRCDNITSSTNIIWPK